MKINRFKFKPEIPRTDYNTNNAWGFGGSFGRQWTFPNGFYYRIGSACFRHLPSKPIEYARNADGQSISLDEFKRACAEWIL